MADNSNTIAGWVLGAGIVALGLSIVSGGIYSADVPETFGYAVEEDTSGAAEADAGPAMETLLASADEAKGEAVFKKCVACHTIEVGGANGIGPNLYSIMGRQLASVSGFAYSDSLKEVGGAWTWEQMDAWLKSPKKFASGTKMSFAGLSKPEDRANVLVYMNGQGSNLPLPEAPVIEEAAPEVAGELSEEAAPVPEGGDVVEATAEDEAAAKAAPAEAPAS